MYVNCVGCKVAMTDDRIMIIDSYDRITVAH